MAVKVVYVLMSTSTGHEVEWSLDGETVEMAFFDGEGQRWALNFVPTELVEVAEALASQAEVMRAKDAEDG